MRKAFEPSMEKAQPAGFITTAAKAVLPSWRMDPWSGRDWAVGCGFVAIYLLLDWISAVHAWSLPGATPWNPHYGMALALLLVLGRRFFPFFVVAVFGAELWMRMELVPVFYRIVEAASVCVIYGLAASVLANRLRFRARIRNVRDLVWVIVVVMLAPLALALVYFSALAHAGLIDWAALPDVLPRYWMGDVLGIIATLPLLLDLASTSGRRGLADLLHRWETFIQLGAICALLFLIFELADQGPVRYFFVMFLPVIWVATRNGLLGACVALFVLVAGLIILIQTHDSRVGTLFELQARVLGLGITALVLGVVVDERRRVQERLQQSMRLVAAGEMAAALAHELNQPLTALVGYGKACQLLLARDIPDKAELSRTVDKSTAQAQRIAAIVSRLRDFLRTGSMNLVRVEVGELIASACTSVAPVSEAESVRVRAEAASGLPAVHVDRTEIEIVLRNLLTNAVESIRDAESLVREVRIEAAAHEPGFVRIGVFDSGPGINPEIKEHLFSAFSTSKAHGMGMGLAVSRAIVEAHGGRLWTESSTNGIFYLTLPTIQGGADADSC
jgi:signal transduction histidine kinase